MPAGKINGLLVIQGNEVNLQACVQTIDQHNGLALPSRFKNGARITPHGVQNKAFDLVGRKRAYARAFTLAFITQVEQHDQIARLAASLLDRKSTRLNSSH